MKNNNGKVITITAHSMLSLSLGMAGSAAVISIVWMVWQLISGSRMPMPPGPVVSLNGLIPQDKLITDTYMIYSVSANLELRNYPINLFLIQSFSNIIVCISIAYGIYILRKLFKNIYNGSHFCPENINIMYRIAIILFIIPPINGVLNFIVVNSFIKHSALKNIIQPVSEFSLIGVFFTGYFIPGMLFILFANVFKKGEKIKEELELTV